MLIACCRAAGIPARYVSGYFHAGTRAEVASHAWVDAWLGAEPGWCSIDVTHAEETGMRHCRLAVGRDYLDAAPVRGVRRGGGRESMSVDRDGFRRHGAAAMTYCVGMLLDAGLVFLADSRTSAGVDQVSTFRKTTVYERPGERVIVLLTAGNLAITQGVIELHWRRPSPTPTIRRRRCRTARRCSRPPVASATALRGIHERDGEALKSQGVEFNATFIVGGQIRGEAPRLFHVSIRRATSSRPRARRRTSRSASRNTASRSSTG